MLIDEPLIKYRQHAFQQIGVFSTDAPVADENFKSFCHRLIEYNQFQKRRLEDIKNQTVEIKSAGQEKKFAILFEMIRREEEYFENIIAHFEKRLNMPSDRGKRLKTITKELLTGRYRRFGRGLISAAKDLTRS